MNPRLHAALVKGDDLTFLKRTGIFRREYCGVGCDPMASQPLRYGRARTASPGGRGKAVPRGNNALILPPASPGAGVGGGLLGVGMTVSTSRGS